MAELGPAQPQLVKQCLVKYLEPKSESVEEGKVLMQTNDLTWVAQERGLKARSRSFPNLNTSWEATAFFKPYVYKVN